MISKHPLELPPKRELSKEEIAEAIRLNIIAELDAINLYEQLANYISDDKVKKVFLDIAKEEKTHAGEFMALLKMFDAEQASELLSGAKEVEALTGISAVKSEPDPLQNVDVKEYDVNSIVKNKVKESAEGARYLRHIIPVVNMGRGTEVAQIIEGEDFKFARLLVIETVFSISQREVDFWKKTGIQPEFVEAQRAGLSLAKLEDEVILFGSEKDGAKGILSCSSAQRLKMSDWEKAGNSVADAALALSMLSSNGIPRPYALLLSPKDYAKLVKYTEHTGISELKRIGELFDKVVMVPGLNEGKGIAMSLSSSVIDLVIGGDTEVDEIGPRNGKIEFRAWETLILRIKIPAGVVILEQ